MNKERQLVLRDPVTNSIRAYLSPESDGAAVSLRMAKPNKLFPLPLQKNTALRNLKGLAELSDWPQPFWECNRQEALGPGLEKLPPFASSLGPQGSCYTSFQPNLCF